MDWVFQAFLLVFDINFAVLWGLLTFVLGFIPYLGIVIAAIPPVLVAWAKYGIYGAVIMGLVLCHYQYHC